MAARGPQPKHAGKTPPLCMGDGCQVRVKRHYGVRLDIAPRVEDGVAWRRFCRRCNASNASTVRHGDAHKGAAATRLKKCTPRAIRRAGFAPDGGRWDRAGPSTRKHERSE
jgi:hypothetical protein